MTTSSSASASTSASQPSQSFTLAFDKSTKGSTRFADETYGSVLPTLYLRKPFAEGASRIRVTIEILP